MARNSKHYFDNEAVEALLTRYVQGACTDIVLRDEIMAHAIPLIRNVILSSGHHKLLQYHHGSNVDDLFAVAWAQLEKTLYKFEPGRAKVFSLWTQITYTCCLAYIKKETRDAINFRKWRDGHPAPLFEKRKKPDFYAVMAELRETVPEEYREMVDALVEIYEEEAQPWIGIIKKLGQRGYSRNVAREFLAHLRTLDGNRF